MLLLSVYGQNLIIPDFPWWIKLLASIPWLLASSVLYFLILFIAEWQINKDNNPVKNSFVLAYPFLTIFISLFSLGCFLLLNLFGFNALPMSKWPWIAFILLISSSTFVGFLLSYVISSLFLIRTKHIADLYLIPRIPRLTKNIIFTFLPIIIIIVLTTIFYSMYLEAPLRACWTYMFIFPFGLVTAVSVYSDFKTNDKGLSLLNGIDLIAKMNDHLERLPTLPEGTSARDVVNNRFNGIIVNIFPAEPLILNVNALNRAEINIQPKAKNKDIISLRVSTNKTDESKIIEIPCKYFSLNKKILDKKIEEGPLPLHNYVLNEIIMSLWRHSYYQTNDEERINQFIETVFDNKIEIVKCYIKLGININGTGGGGWSATMAAAAQGNSEILKLLLELGGDPNHKNLMLATALMHAAKHNDVKSVKLLVDYGANLDLQDYQGFTALMRAIEKRCKDTAILLLKAGANKYLNNHENKNALKLAEKYNLGDIARIIRTGNFTPIKQKKKKKRK
jgi:hypothetical protein